MLQLCLFGKVIDLLHDKGPRSYVSCMVVHRDSVMEAAMMLRLSHLRGFPSIFRNLTGVTVAVFDLLLEDLRPAFAAAHRRRLDRPDRRRGRGAAKSPRRPGRLVGLISAEEPGLPPAPDGEPRRRRRGA